MCKRGEKIRVVGVSRGNEYSPNHVDNDAAILRLAAEVLGGIFLERGGIGENGV